MNSASPLSIGGGEPRPGDIVVTHDVEDDLFTVSQFPGLGQVSASSHPEALAIAAAFAARHAVDLWYHDGRRCEVVHRHRAGAEALGGRKAAAGSRSTHK